MKCGIASLVFFCLFGCAFGEIFESTVPVKRKLNENEEAYLQIPDAEKTWQYLVDLSTEPSLAGTEGSYDDAVYTVELYKEWGVPQVDMVEYDTLMCYGVSRSLTVLSPTPYNARLDEVAFPEDPTSNNPNIPVTVLGYAASGNVTGDLVYVNYGRPEDFELLNEVGVPLDGKIALARYGQMFRGLKIKLAEENGMVGAILFSDPLDDGYAQGPVYPGGPYRPPEGVQMGSGWYINLYAGDPLTPGVAAVPDLPADEKKYTYDDAPPIPRIPAIPIGYGDAQNILSQLGGIDVTVDPRFEGWQGGLPFSYHIGATGDTSANFNIQNEFPIRRLYNVIATFPGDVEPDRQVIAGGHRDGWIFGAIDPHAGTAPLMEMTRAFAELYEQGWRPRRTIVTASWDGEEYGLIGSTEWVEEFQDQLFSEAVAYLNVDGAAGGTRFSASGSPSLGHFVREVTQSIVNPNTNNTIYTDWIETTGHDELGNLGSGSDYTAFLDYLGIASLDFGFGGGSGGSYHSRYDSIAFYDRNIDKIYLELVAKILGLMTMRLAEAEILPFDHREYGLKLAQYTEDLRQLLLENNLDVDLDPLYLAVGRFQQAAFDASRPGGPLTPEQIRQLNNRLMWTERGFIAPGPTTLYKRDEGWFRHVIYAPSYAYGYAGVILPGPTEAAQDMSLEDTIEQLDLLVSQINDAATVLNGDLFM